MQIGGLLPLIGYPFILNMFLSGISNENNNIFYLDWLVGCFGFNGPLRQYFSLYRAYLEIM